MGTNRQEQLIEGARAAIKAELIARSNTLSYAQPGELRERDNECDDDQAEDRSAYSHGKTHG